MLADQRRWSRWILGLAVALLSVLTQDLAGRQAAQAPQQASRKTSADDAARQVTVFAILATNDSGGIDPQLASVNSLLRKVLPGHGFRLLDVESKRLQARQSVNCNLGNGYRAETVLVRPLDENGKVQLRCNLLKKGTKEFSTLVKTPMNQLFFYERSLEDGSRVLIGVGARDAPTVVEPQGR